MHARQHALVRFAWLLSGGVQADAEDLVQEALSRLYGRWHAVDDPERYLRTAIVRLNVSRWRKLRREVLIAGHVERAVPDDRLEATYLWDLPTGRVGAVMTRVPDQRLLAGYGWDIVALPEAKGGVVFLNLE